MMEITRTKSKEEAVERAVSRLNKILDAHSHVPILFLASGGSSLALLERITVFPPKLTVGVTDERFDEDPSVNNFVQLVETPFFEKAQDRGAYFIDTRVQPREELEVFAKRFESSLMNWQAEHPGGRIVITQGVGPDGHTAGIMPHPTERDVFQELFEGKQLVQGYDAKEKNEYPLRVTITLPFLRMVDHSIVYMTGREKKDALSRMLKAEVRLWETPARIIHEMKEVHVFTDIH
tara:strand:- start:685 stop:1389 length:705 start_codon:yes stop_codon:yes gene_type:complete